MKKFKISFPVQAVATATITLNDDEIPSTREDLERILLYRAHPPNKEFQHDYELAIRKLPDILEIGDVTIEEITNH